MNTGSSLPHVARRRPPGAAAGPGVAADPCPTLLVTMRAPRIVRSNKLSSLSIAGKNTDALATDNMQVAVSREAPGVVR